MGQAPPGDSYNTDSEGWPLVAGAGDFVQGVAKPKKFTTQPTKVSQAGDVILGIRASIGEKVLADGEYCLGRGVASIRPSTELHGRFLWHWLTYVARDLVAKGRGATFKQVNRQDIAELPISLPVMQNQQQCAAMLDQVDMLRAKRREAIALLDELAESVFIDMFGDPSSNDKGWPVRVIGDLIESASYGTSQKASGDGDFPVLRMGNVTSRGRIDLSDLKYLQRSEVKDKHLVHPGDVLFNRTNSADLVGKTAVYRSGPPVAYAGYLVRIRMNSRNHPEYLAAYLNSRYGKRILRNMCKSIIGMANINAREMQGISIPEPPTELQRDFAQRLQGIEQLRASHEAHLAHLDELFASVQQRAFRGELWED